MRVGKMRVGKMRVGEMRVGEMRIYHSKKSRVVDLQAMLLTSFQGPGTR